MNTSDQTAADVKAPVSIIEADIAHFLATRFVDLNIPDWATLGVSRTAHGTDFSVYGHSGSPTKWIYGSGKSVDAAFAEFQKQLPPTGALLAAQKRAEADKLLREAEEIESPRIIITDENGFEQGRSTIVEFVRNNVGLAVTASEILTSIDYAGECRIDLGAGGVVTLRTAPAAETAEKVEVAS